MSNLMDAFGIPPLPAVGQNVVFTGCSEDQSKWGYGYIDASVLTVGAVYWVSKIEVHSWHTKVWLGEGDLGPFNSVCFEPIALSPLSERPE